MYKIKVIAPYNDTMLGRQTVIGEEYEVDNERYEALKVLEPRYLIGEEIKSAKVKKEDIVEVDLVDEIPEDAEVVDEVIIEEKPKKKKRK